MTYGRRPPLKTQRYFQSQEMGRWLNTFSWDLFATLTLKPDVCLSPKQLEWLFVNFISKLDKGITFFWAMEWQNCRAVPHLHALVGNLQDIDQRLSLEGWAEKYGRFQVESYDALKDGCFYVVKNITTDRLIGWDVSDSLCCLPEGAKL